MVSEFTVSKLTLPLAVVGAAIALCVGVGGGRGVVGAVRDIGGGDDAGHPTDQLRLLLRRSGSLGFGRHILHCLAL